MFVGKKAEKGNTNGYRFSLTITGEEERQIVEEFKFVCKKQKKRYTRIALTLFKEFIDVYHATR